MVQRRLTSWLTAAVQIGRAPWGPRTRCECGIMVLIERSTVYEFVGARDADRSEIPPGLGQADINALKVRRTSSDEKREI